jgi:hypothetical protein
MKQEHVELTESLVESVIQSYFTPLKGEILDLDKCKFDLQETMDDIFKVKIKVTVSNDRETLRVTSNDVPFEELIIEFNTK